MRFLKLPEIERPLKDVHISTKGHLHFGDVDLVIKQDFQQLISELGGAKMTIDLVDDEGKEQDEVAELLLSMRNPKPVAQRKVEQEEDEDVDLSYEDIVDDRYQKLVFS